MLLLHVFLSEWARKMKLASRIAAIDNLVFDMDGTLIDSMSQHAEVFSLILSEEYSVPRDFSRQKYLNTAGQALDNQFINVLDLSKRIRRANVKELIERFWMHIVTLDVILFPDVLFSIEYLFKAGYRLIVSSNCAPFIVTNKLFKSGLGSYFALQLGTDRSIPGMFKGAGHFSTIQSELCLTQGRFRRTTAFVGDADYDMTIGRAAGLLTVGRGTGVNGDSLKSAGAHIVIPDLRELCNIMTRH